MNNRSKTTQEKYYAMKNIIKYYDFYKGNKKNKFEKELESISSKLTSDEVMNLKLAYEESSEQILNVLANSHRIYVKFDKTNGQTIDSSEFFDI